MTNLNILIDELEGSLWCATLKKHKLYGLEIDPAPDEEAVRWGSIFWARVIRIDKSLDAAFVLLSEEGFTGILHNKDLCLFDKDGNPKDDKGEAIGKRIKTGDMLVVQAKNGYLPQLNSQDVIIEDKSPRVSMNITLPGRHLIFSPMMKDNRISKRVKDKKQRKQMNKMLDTVASVNGCILRASAAWAQTDVLVREAMILKDIWDQLQQFLEGNEPALIMEGPDAVQRTLSDHAGKLIDSIEIVTHEQYQEVEEWCEVFAPDLVTKIEPIELPDMDMDLSLFDFRDVLDQVEDLFQVYVLMKSGGSLIMQPTAAMFVVDVNRGGDIRSNLEINLEAMAEISRQIRLRNLGGIIIIDFLKLKNKKDKDAMVVALEKMVEDDPCTVQVHGTTALGLVEITRNRRTPALQDRLDIVLE